MIMIIIPLCVAVSILLNDFPFLLDEHDPLHLKPCLIFSVSKKRQLQMAKKKNRKKTLFPFLTWLRSHLVFLPPVFFLHSWIIFSSPAQLWLGNFNMMFMWTCFYRHDLFFLFFSLVAVWTMHNRQFASRGFRWAFLTSVSDCSLSLRSLISSHVANESF